MQTSMESTIPAGSTGVELCLVSELSLWSNWTHPKDISTVVDVVSIT